MSSHAVPIIGLFGPAGSGKDTVGSYIKAVFGGVCVAQADPMKRFAQAVFGFEDDTLWGDTKARNVVHDWTVTDRNSINERAHKLLAGTFPNLEFFRAPIVPSNKTEAGSRALQMWFDNIYHNLENDIPISARLVLQTLGTEWGRGVDRDMWSRYAIETCRKLLSGDSVYDPCVGTTETKAGGFDFACITDGRFRNECINIRMAGGIAIKIERDTDTATVDAAGVKNHVSEKELNSIPAHFFNQVIQNNGSIAELTQKIDGIMNYYYGV